MTHYQQQVRDDAAAPVDGVEDRLTNVRPRRGH